VGHMNRTLYACAATLSLLIGCTLYLSFRPTSLIMFHWAKAVGLMPAVLYLRGTFAFAFQYLPSWVVYSMPFALYVLSYMLLVKTIWWRSRSISYQAWLWLLPFLSLISEIGQWAKVVPGTFDVMDVGTVLAVVCSALVFRLHSSKEVHI